MKKALIITVAGIVVLIAAVCIIAGAVNKGRIPDIFEEGSDPVPVNLPENAKLTELSFDYSIAMNREGSYTFTVKDLGYEGCILEIESPVYNEDEVFRTEISRDEFSAAADLVNALDLDKWNGYHKYATHVLDGDSFSSSFVFSTPDGSTVSINASGTNASPEGKWGLQKGLENLFGQYKKQYDYDRIPKTIKSDNLECLFVTFKQQGNSGFSHYSFELRKETWEGGYNVNASYLDYTGEFGPEMKRESEMKTILAKDVKDLDLSPVQKVLRKYDIASINGYDATAEDYNNSEWFQISASYEEESLNIMGTEKFPDYDAFRKDFLKACIEVAGKYEE